MEKTRGEKKKVDGENVRPRAKKLEIERCRRRLVGEGRMGVVTTDADDGIRRWIALVHDVSSLALSLSPTPCSQLSSP